MDKQVNLPQLLTELQTEIKARFAFILEIVEKASSTVIGTGFLTGVLQQTETANNYAELYQRAEVYSEDVNIILNLVTQLSLKFNLDVGQNTHVDNDSVLYQDFGFIRDEVSNTWTSDAYEVIYATREQPQDVAEIPLISEGFYAHTIVCKTFEKLIADRIKDFIYGEDDVEF